MRHEDQQVAARVGSDDAHSMAVNVVSWMLLDHLQNRERRTWPLRKTAPLATR